MDDASASPAVWLACSKVRCAIEALPDHVPHNPSASPHHANGDYSLLELDSENQRTVQAPAFQGSEGGLWAPAGSIAPVPTHSRRCSSRAFQRNGSGPRLAFHPL